ncbi:helix-turn-helix domain-containing protein [Anaerofustis sp.]|uniref:helix-turn-helix domain-containing protein n=1 Tax=Anaerofustis sp. TaxID=1872517 RepID=UPI0025BF3F9E|nr:helix-turn-helix domain-containing protein [Anaerofustis sp.]
MDIYERFRYLRKDKLKLSQTEFGLRVGVTIGVIKNIEQKKVKPKELFIQQVCKEYHVNYAWITQEQGEIFDNNENVIIDEFAKKYNLDKTDINIIKNYLQLEPDKREIFKEYFKNILNK